MLCTETTVMFTFNSFYYSAVYNLEKYFVITSSFHLVKYNRAGISNFMATVVLMFKYVMLVSHYLFNYMHTQAVLMVVIWIITCKRNSNITLCKVWCTVCCTFG